MEANGRTYPTGALAIGYAPRLVLPPRRMSDDEIMAIVSKFVAPGRRPIGNADVGLK
ncbi:hypothetical protein K3U93_06700 [Mycobacterium malmoense]|uniref:hypothetical protein n=1 Tax=Mycobacterium malmoense TaxID=1780 RepID=UPI0015939BC7|nr:hypothetical protein [Mycobacterium malmoense]QZA18846.1 hypothetical protein K3U93_06700 [Mycobacterium malmoense]UNB95617.1 hypothetical protein H5T25_06695 [Mycobacterium malmoense]